MELGPAGDKDERRGLQLLVDQVAIRAVIEGYAQAADRVDGAGLAALFTDDGVLTIHDTPGSREGARVLTGHGRIAAAITGLERYTSTSHQIGSHTCAVDGDRAEADSSGQAHHVTADPAGDWNKVWHLRYHDVLVRQDGAWRIAERTLFVDIVEHLPVVAAGR